MLQQEAALEYEDDLRRHKRLDGGPVTDEAQTSSVNCKAAVRELWGLCAVLLSLTVITQQQEQCGDDPDDDRCPRQCHDEENKQQYNNKKRKSQTLLFFLSISYCHSTARASICNVEKQQNKKFTSILQHMIKK